mmetsp:Transcript_25939/g.42512  ORF Transcript_25939/g.42512 Transcript_25939/m.42512 type:complete len:187 (+) Transcript_25939:107-667(+)
MITLSISLPETSFVSDSGTESKRGQSQSVLPLAIPGKDELKSLSSAESSESLHCHPRRTSSVSFSDETEVQEFLKTENQRQEIWYTAEELSEIRHQCKLEAQRTITSTGNIERGLENMIPRGSQSPSDKKYSREIVFSENANQILEYGYLCDTERLAHEYKQATEASKIQALVRGFSDSLKAWGEE